MRVTGGLRYRVCPDCGDMHDRDEWPDNHRRPEEVVCLPAMYADGMNDLWHPHDGRVYDSKYDFRKVTKASGGMEMGNDEQKDTRVNDRVTEADVGEAIQKVNQGYRPSLSSTSMSGDGWQ